MNGAAMMKPWYLSRTIWASLISVAALLATMLGVPFDDAEAAMLVDAVLHAVAAAASVLAILGRIVATSRIGRDVVP